jgi:hypothetical protein
LITLQISGRPFFRRADDVAPSLQRLMHQLAQKIKKIIYWERFSQSVIFPINVWENPCCVHAPAIAAAEL